MVRRVLPNATVKGTEITRNPAQIVNVLNDTQEVSMQLYPRREDA